MFQTNPSRPQNLKAFQGLDALELPEWNAKASLLMCAHGLCISFPLRMCTNKRLNTNVENLEVPRSYKIA
jgi:hypothetical protein